MLELVNYWCSQRLPGDDATAPRCPNLAHGSMIANHASIVHTTQTSTLCTRCLSLLLHADNCALPFFLLPSFEPGE